MLKRSVGWTLLFIFLSLGIRAQSLIFEHLGVKEGLSQFTVHDFYQDEYGQMWIATSDGLNRYDGKKMQSFRPAVGDTTGLLGSNILAVTGNAQGKIYLICLSGLLAYDLKTQKFEILAKKGVNTLAYAPGKVWIGSENVLKYYDETSRTFIDYKTFPKGVLIKTILKGEDGALFIGTNEGLYEMDQNGKVREMLREVFTMCLFEGRDKSLWVGTLENGLYRINNRNEITHFKHSEQDPQSVSDDFIRAICQDDLGGYWIGTFKGLDYFDPETRTFRNFKHSPVESHSLSDMSVWCIKKDSQGSLWIGTYFGGVNIFNPEYSFSRFYRPTGQQTGPNSAILGRVTEDSKGNLWICSDYGGLNYFDIGKNTFKYFKSAPGSLSSNILKDLYLDKEVLWIGSHLGGLDKMDLKSGKITRIGLNTGNRSIDKYVRRITPYGKLLLLGTHDGIQVFDPNDNSIRPLLPAQSTYGKGQVWDMMIDRRGVLWFSIRGLVGKYDLKKGELLPVKDNLQFHNAVFFEDSRGQVWMGGAGKGLFCIKGEEVISYHTGNSGLADNYILDIEESNAGYILISTNKGLSRFNLTDQVFYNYNNHQFFPFEALNEKSIYVKKSGEIILSSLSGLMMISEKDLLYHPKPHEILFTNLSLNNQDVRPGEGILSSALTSLNRIDVSEKYSSLKIDFAVTNYIKMLQPKVEYMLEGFDDKWLSVPPDYSLNFTNLSSGTYTLKLRSLYGGKEMASSALEIHIQPRFYKTWYAYLFYLCVIGGILFLLYSQVRLKDSLKNADIQAKHLEEVNQSKLRFFMNVSHEIRTPVTLIMAQLDMLLNSSTPLSPSVLNRLQNIKKNAANLKKLITELLDFKKQEEGLVKLKCREEDLVKYLHTVFVSFQDYANSLNIHLAFYSSEEQIMANFDVMQMEKVMYNLFSNAMKFTPPGGEVRLQVGIQGSQAEIILSDTGIGISELSISQIFDRFYQAEDIAVQPLDPGTGIGLSLVKDIVEQHQGSISVSSRLGKGTRFRILLPLREKKVPVPAREMGTSKQKKLHKLFIAEDNSDLQGVLSDLFSPMYDVLTEGDGKAVFERVKAEKPALVLLDVMLPNVSGFEICKRIKSDLSTKEIPVVLLTAAASGDKKIEGLQMGADDYVTKPFDARELVIRCNSLINNRQELKAGLNKEKVYGSNEPHELFIKEATEVVTRNIDNADFSVGQFAVQLNVSRSSLFSKMKEITGQTPNDFIQEVRLKKGLELLNKDDSVNQIAFAVGFNDPSYFIKQFRKYYGVTPGQYKAGKRKVKPA